jgi:hypothetical protein
LANPVKLAAYFPGQNARPLTRFSYFLGIVFIMLSPTSLAGLSIGTDWMRPVRQVNSVQGPSSGRSQPANPLAPLALPGSGGQSDGGAPSRSLPRGSLLDLSV